MLSQVEQWEAVHSKKTWGVWPCDALLRLLNNTIKYSRKKELRWLDIGCGNGSSMVAILSQKGYEVFGIDISPTAIENTRIHLKNRLNIEANLVVGDVLKLPYEDNFFDIAIDFCTLQHLPYHLLPLAYQEIARVLVKDGLFFTKHRAKSSWLEPIENTIYPLNRKELTVFLSKDFDIDCIETESGSGFNEAISMVHYLATVFKKGE